MTRDELEAVILRASTYIDDEGASARMLGPAAVDGILSAADQYAESEHKRRLSVAYARLLDVPVMDGPKRSDEKEPA